MPSPIESLWQAIHSKKYDEAWNIIESNPDSDLINSSNPKNSYPLMMQIAYQTNNKSTDLLKKIVIHEKLDLQQVCQKIKKSNLAVLICQSEVDALTLLSNDPRILVDRYELSYNLAAKEYAIASYGYEADKAEDPNSKATQSSKEGMDIYQKITSMLLDKTIQSAKKLDPTVLIYKNELIYSSILKNLAEAQKEYQKWCGIDAKSLNTVREKERYDNLVKLRDIIRDATIRYAIQNDDATLFEALLKAGTDPDELTDGTITRDLLTKDHVNVNKWFNEQLSKVCTQISTGKNSLFAKQKEVQAIKQQIKQETARFYNHQINTLSTTMDKRSDKLESYLNSGIIK